MIRCKTVRQLSAQERWNKEFVLSIKGTPWSPDGERAGDVNIRVDLPEAGGDRCAHPPDIDPPTIPGRMRLTREMFERFGLVAQCPGCRAIRTGVGYPANHSERCRERVEQELEKRARDMRVEDTEQGPDREVIELTGASSSRDGAGNEQEATGDPLQCLNHNHAKLNRVSVMASPQENKVMMQTWPILTVTGGDPESRLGRKEKQRESGSMFWVAKKAMNGWRLKRNGCEFTVVPDEIYSLPITLKVDPS